MNTATNHEGLREMLPEAALGTLDGSDLRQVLAHARECAECAGLLAEYREVVAGLALVAPQLPLDQDGAIRLRARLLARAREDMRASAPKPDVVAGGRRLSPSGPTATGWMGWAVAAGLAGVLLMHHAVHRPLDYGWMAAGALTVILVAVGGYALAQRGRASALRDRLSSLERDISSRG
jgi:hypothetical protein